MLVYYVVDKYVDYFRWRKREKPICRKCWRKRSVLPVTSRYRGLLSHVELDSGCLKVKSYIKTEDIRSISTRRCIKKISEVDRETIRSIEEKLKFLLGFV
jgi:mRNA-degrading endonuclease toxin of MazEF toxin-antitoxin module